jgi:hypothetical protein
MRRVALFAAVLGLTALVARIQAGGGEPRQVYGDWQYNKEKNYYYREFKYKPNPKDAEYKKDYCIYFKDDAKINNKWVYFYNPITEKYWARYPTVHNDMYKKYAEKRLEAWAELPAKYRQKDIYAIEKKAWPAPKLDYCPTIPGAVDAVPIMAPPSDLP